MANAYNGILFSNEKEWTTTWRISNILLGEERLAKKTACFFISFLLLSVKGRTMETESRSTVARRGRGRILMTKKHKGVFRVQKYSILVTVCVYLSKLTELFIKFGVYKLPSLNLIKKLGWASLGGLVAKTLHSQCRGPRFDPGSGN